jgi:hypothetical protein
MLSDKVKIELIKAAPKLMHIEFIELVAEECQRAQRQWVGLTDEEIDDIEAIWEATQEWVSFRHATRAIEAKLKEKNT